MISTLPAPSPARRSHTLLKATAVAMILGVSVGWVLELAHLPASTQATIIKVLGVITTLFLRLIRMIVAPLIFSNLVIGIAQMDNAGSVGRVGLRALAWFVTASIVAIGTGLIMANVMTPGAGMNLQAPTAAIAAAPVLDAAKMIEEFVPTSIVDAMAQNRILQIVVFAVFAGIALGALGEGGRTIRSLAEQTSKLMSKIAGYVMNVAPLAVFSALVSTTLEHGIGMIAILGRFVVEYYITLMVLAALLTAAGAIFLGTRLKTLLGLIREPFLIAFSTASSEASYPAAYAAVQRFGVSQRVAGLILPLGYAFNLDGLLVYASFCVLFIAQAYGIVLDWPTQIGIMFFLLVANKGAAGVPRGGLVNLTVALQMFNLPVAGVALILGLDAIMDMGRSAVNVLGNAIATSAVAGMEGELSATDLSTETA